MKVAYLDTRRDWLPSLLGDDHEVERLNAANLRTAATSSGWRCDHLLLHVSDLETDDLPPGANIVTLEAGEGARQLTVEEVIQFVLRFFPPDKVTGSVWLYSGGTLSFHQEGHLVVVGYGVPYSDPPARFKRLLTSFDVEDAKAAGAAEVAIEDFAALDILCQGYLVMGAASGIEVFENQNPVAGAAKELADGTIAVDSAEAAAARRDMGLTDDGPQHPATWFCITASEETEPDTGPGTFIRAQSWAGLVESLSGNQHHVQEGIERFLEAPPEGLEAYRRIAAEHLGWTPDDAHHEGLCAIADFVSSLENISGAAPSQVPTYLIRRQSMPASLEDWYTAIRNAHVGYVMLASAIFGE